MSQSASTSSSSAAEAVLVLVPGACGAPADGAEPFHVADEQAPQLLVTDLVATRGDGVFETIGVFDGKAINVGPHLRRLARSAQMVELPEPDLEVLTAAVDAAIAAHPAVPELTVRVLLTRGVEGSGVPTCWVHAKTAADWSHDRAGVKVVTLDRGVPSTVTETSPWLLAGAKTLSYASNMAALREANRRGADDVLYLSSDGYCLEGPTSTLLVRHADVFTTTPVSAGVLPGTSVGSVFDHLRSSGAQVREELMTPQDVISSDGAWLLSSGRLAAPITHLDEQSLIVHRELTDTFIAVLSGKI